MIVLTEAEMTEEIVGEKFAEICSSRRAGVGSLRCKAGGRESNIVNHIDTLTVAPWGRQLAVQNTEPPKFTTGKVTTVFIWYCDYFGTMPKNSHKR